MSISGGAYAAQIYCEVVIMTKQEAIKNLQDLRKQSDGSNERAKADTILCDFLDAMGYGDVVFEFRKVQEVYPVVTPKYAKPSDRR
jgi:hypothetical protein